MNRFALVLCSSLLLLAACSAEVAVDTPPTSTSIPITSIGDPVYAEVAVDLPAETQGLDVIVKEVSATFTVQNTSTVFTLTTSARVSLTGTAEPDQVIFYTDRNRPAYYATAGELLASTNFAPRESKDVNVTSPVLAQALGKQRLWVIVSNSISRVGIGTQPLPLEINLNNIVIHATVTKEFRGLEGLLGPGGL